MNKSDSKFSLMTTATGLTVLLAFLMLTGCAGVSVYQNSVVTAYGGSGIDSRKEVSYYLVTIRNDTASASLLESISIVLPNADHPVRLSQLNYDFVARTLPRWEPPVQWNNYARERNQLEKQKRAIEDFAVSGIYIAFKDKILWQISLCSHCEGQRFETAPLIREGGACSYRLPLTQQELRKLFGDATKISTQNEIYY